MFKHLFSKFGAIPAQKPPTSNDCDLNLANRRPCNFPSPGGEGKGEGELKFKTKNKPITPDLNLPDRRNGKIARLPRDLREKINQLLYQGKTAVSIAHWLNTIPAVKTLLKAEFDGRPINNQNLTEWKQGGYRDWLMQGQLLDQIGDRAADAHDIALAAKGMADSLFAILTLDYARAIKDREHESPEEFEKKRQTLSVLSQDVIRLRRCHLQARRIELAEERFEHEQVKSNEQVMAKFLEWAQNPIVRQALSLAPPEMRPKIRRLFDMPPLPEDPANLENFDQIQTDSNQKTEPESLSRGPHAPRVPHSAPSPNASSLSPQGCGKLPEDNVPANNHPMTGGALPSGTLSASREEEPEIGARVVPTRSSDQHEPSSNDKTDPRTDGRDGALRRPSSPPPTSEDKPSSPNPPNSHDSTQNQALSNQKTEPQSSPSSQAGGEAPSSQLQPSDEISPSDNDKNHPHAFPSPGGEGKGEGELNTIPPKPKVYHSAYDQALAEGKPWLDCLYAIFKKPTQPPPPPVEKKPAPPENIYPPVFYPMNPKFTDGPSLNDYYGPCDPPDRPGDSWKVHGG